MVDPRHRPRLARRRPIHVAALASSLATTLALVSSPPAHAADLSLNRVVSTDPVDWTPQVVSSGSVHALVQSGTRMVAGGNFTEVRGTGADSAVTRRNLFSFDAATGRIAAKFRPRLDGMVRALAISRTGRSVFVGGQFRTVNGKSRVSLTKLSLKDGSIRPRFKTPALDGRVFTMRRVNDRLVIGGSFTRVAGKRIGQLAALNPRTGAVDTSFRATFRGANNPENPGFRVIRKIDVSPTGSRLAAIGNFMRVNGEERPQLALFDISSGKATLVNWQTNRYRQPCGDGYSTYMRDVDFSPDGSYFAVVTAGGGYTGLDQSVGCSSVARWQTAPGTNLQPRWIRFTGNDALHSVETTGAAIYTGGHNRWMNNPFGSDVAGPGAVARPGLAALAPATGLPLSWNPGRTLGTGVFDLLATRTGLWIGHDTNWVARESHKKLAFFPLA